MILPHLSSLLAAGALVVGTAATLPAQAPPVSLVSARVGLAGTSNVHDYTASSTTIRLTRVEVAGVKAGEGWAGVLRPGALEAFEIAVPVTSLHSPREGLDKNMHKALLAKAHPDIVFRLRRLELRNGATHALGVLRVAGTEREVSFEIRTQQKQESLVVTGSVDLVMTDFGITPPKAMLGMLKTDPRVTVSFEVVLASSLT